MFTTKPLCIVYTNISFFFMTHDDNYRPFVFDFSDLNTIMYRSQYTVKHGEHSRL